jgi:tetratricopeptide (TPR) repeat protein
VTRIEEAEMAYLAELDGLQAIVSSANHPARVAEAALLIARADERVGRADRALDAYRTLIDTYPDQVAAGSALAHSARIHQQQGPPQRAAVTAARAVGRHPDSVSLATVGAQLIRDSCGNGRACEQAKQLLQQLILDHPGTEAGAAGHLALGDLWLDEGNSARAEGVWGALLALPAYEPTAAFPLVVERLSLTRLQLAETARREGRNSDALAVLELLLNDPHPARAHGEALAQLADVYEELARFGDAVAVYKQLEATAGDEQSALWLHYHQGRLLQRTGQTDEGCELFRTVLDQQPSDNNLVAACMAGLAFCHESHHQ